MSPSTLDALSAYALSPLPSLDLPPIPQIADPEYYEIVTTHASCRKEARSNHELNPKVALKDYEKLEHVGDALLGAVVAVILHDLFPMIGEGPASMLKGQLVSNAILAQISERYGLPSLLRTDPGAQYTVRKNVKAQASLFEAWVAGVYYTVLDSLDDSEEEEEEEERGERGGEESVSEGESEGEAGKASIGREGDAAGDGKVNGNEGGEGTVQKEARSVRFSKDVIVQELEPASLSSSEQESVKDKQDEGSPTDSASPSTFPSSPDGVDDKKAKGGEATEDAQASDASDIDQEISDDPFAQLLHASVQAETLAPASPIADTCDAQGCPVSGRAATSPSTPADQLTPPCPANSVPSSPPPSDQTSLPTPDPASNQQNAIRLRWLAMCVLDDWLRPIFTPLALWAMECLRAEQIRIRAARTKAYMDVDALDAKTKGCMTLMNALVQRGEVEMPVYEVQQVDEGWKVGCRVVKKSREVFTAHSIRTAKKPAQNIATYRILLQLGEVDDADELARSVIGSSSGSPSSSSSDVDTSESSAAEESGSGMDA